MTNLEAIKAFYKAILKEEGAVYISHRDLVTEGFNLVTAKAIVEVMVDVEIEYREEVQRP